MPRPAITVFTKPWTEDLGAMADKLAALGVDGVELAVRPGYQVVPETVSRDLPRAAARLAESGLTVPSIASGYDEATIAACGEAGVGVIRICAGIDMAKGYLASVDAYRRAFDAALPALEKHGVAIGVQNHHGHNVGSAIGLRHMLEGYDPRQVCAVLDMAHCALDGEPVDMAVDIVKDRMNGLVNFKSAYYHRVTGPEEDEARFRVQWTTHDHGGYSWRALVQELRKIGFEGTFCMPAEYSPPFGVEGKQRMGDAPLPLLRHDLAHLRALIDDIYG
ncbi:TIM barrel protein [Rhodobacteraceae bacterium 2CG4]|uniref:TIM barrel protein n=1 Tax=Halovulum marinum TaxID=2662447 RepID=A0A6L5YXQ5_9RHOB|nr:TIM barrel protein [Halovulum marinum]MSU89116.1 TIM barrel protein [Halovulum marinum]